jgi:hypothetical protein
MTADQKPIGSDWFTNDELFAEQLKTGHDHAVRVAERLRAEGLSVAITPMEMRVDINDRHRFIDEHDLTVGVTRPCRVDVKSRTLHFTGVEDYPYPTAFVDTVGGWEAKVNKPMAIVLISQPTGAMLVVSVRDAPLGWTRERHYDHGRGIHDSFYMVSREQLRIFDQLVRWLHDREADDRQHPVLPR